MKILIDPQIYTQWYGGISRYHTEVYKHLKKEAGLEIKCPIIFSENFHLREHRLLPILSIIITKWGSRQNRDVQKKLYQRNHQLTLKALQQKKWDVFVPTYYDPYFLPYLNDTPFVLTVYDMIHELFPGYFNDHKQVREQKRLLMDKSTRIIAISENTKKDILKIYPDMPAEKIDVVYLAHSVREVDLAKEPKYTQYILFVGNRGGYKRFDRLVEMIAPWLKENNYKLVCAGGGAFNKEEQDQISRVGIQDHIYQQNFLDDELASFYKGALAFVFPSEYEGFGIPVLEAMACRCPVILPYLSSFPEVAGEAGLYFDLGDATSLLDLLDQLKSDSDFRAAVVEKGMEQQMKFSWSKTAESCLKIFEHVI